MSYICRLSMCQSLWFWYIIGINGKFVLKSTYYKKRSYAVNRAKSFCARVKGVRYDI